MMMLAFALCTQEMSMQQFTEHEVNLPQTVMHNVRYVLSLPEGYNKGRKRYPILIFLHGAGERGSDLAKVKVHGPPRLVAEGKPLPFILVAPQCDEGKVWNVDALSTMLDDIEKRYRVDKDREYLTGLSMGGYGTWEWATRQPNRFAAIMPVCGGGSRIWGRRLAGMPIWCAHGIDDTVVPITESQIMIDASRAAGARIRFTKYEGVGHDSWTPFYGSQPWVEWLLSHRLQDRIPKKAGVIQTPPPGEYVEEVVKK